MRAVVAAIGDRASGGLLRRCAVLVVGSFFSISASGQKPVNAAWTHFKGLFSQLKPYYQ
jgi:hypothetical protein